MKKIYVQDICKEIEPQLEYVSVDVTLTKVIHHITRHIDPTLPSTEFRAWADSDAEEPFRWNRTNYYWENKG